MTSGQSYDWSVGGRGVRRGERDTSSLRSLVDKLITLQALKIVRLYSTTHIIIISSVDLDT